MTGSGVGRVLTVGGLFFGVALIVGLRSPDPLIRGASHRRTPARPAQPRSAAASTRPC